jgi:hypothetical protein
MKTLSKETISEIEDALKLHINYKGLSSHGKYLKKMDNITLRLGYVGPKGIALSSMLNDYFKQIGVDNLEQALSRLRTQNK